MENPNSLDEESEFPHPLPERNIDLMSLKADLYPIDEEKYWKATDDFLGGKSFFRVAGCPLWLQEPEIVKCLCNDKMVHIMSIGYENWLGPFQYLEDKPFFIGETALYAFFCDKCCILKIISQSS